MEKSEIIALIEALCERPLADRQAEPPAELQAFCREAAKALSQADVSAHREPDTVADTDRLTAALATLFSGSDAEAARRIVAEATLRSAAARLDAESAFAFVDAIEQSPQTAPADLVEEMLAADRAGGAGPAPRQGAGISALWLRIAGGSWPAPRWRMAAACAVLLVAGVASWSAYWPQTRPNVSGPAAPMAKTTTATEQRSVADAPAPPVLATQQPCEPRDQAKQTATLESNAPAAAAKAKANASAEVDCNLAPGHQFADRPTDENAEIAARQQAEAARQAASARAATDAASKLGATQADQSGPVFGKGNFNRPSATMSAPAAVPAMRPAAPAMRPAAPAAIK